jgi:hypothetical protein
VLRVFLQHCIEFRRSDWLAEVFVHSRRQAFLPVRIAEQDHLRRPGQGCEYRVQPYITAAGSTAGARDACPERAARVRTGVEQCRFRFLTTRGRESEKSQEEGSCGSAETFSYRSLQSPLATTISSQAERNFSYHVSVNFVIRCSAVCPAIVTPECTTSPQVCTRVPPPTASSKLTHCASTTPSE